MPLENKLGSLSLDSDGDDGDVEDYLVIGIDFGTT
jgi:hypothetical protein